MVQIVLMRFDFFFIYTKMYELQDWTEVVNPKY